MHHYSVLLAASSLLAVAHGHGVLLAVEGIKGSPIGKAFGADDSVARNCTGITPCQQDTSIIRDAEIRANVVNQCGRTELKGNIDVGESTENDLAAGAVTQVKAGSKVKVTIHQVNADGAGPYFCDLDETSNTASKLINLTVENNVPGANGLSQAKTQDFDIFVTMPDNLKCVGASTGNVCTLRCRNNAVAGPFGGCAALQQVDTKQTVNTPERINTEQDFKSVQEQVLINQADFGKAVAANQAAGTKGAESNLEALNAILADQVQTAQFPQQTPNIGNNNNQNNNKDGQRGGDNNNNNNNKGGQRGGDKKGGQQGGQKGGQQGGQKGGQKGGDNGGNNAVNNGGNNGANNGGRAGNGDKDKNQDNADKAGKVQGDQAAKGKKQNQKQNQKQPQQQQPQQQQQRQKNAATQGKDKQPQQATKQAAKQANKQEGKAATQQKQNVRQQGAARRAR